jgi:uncharacterized membrane protein YccF (DUF307 family)
VAMTAGERHAGVMRTLGNVLWLLFAGIWLAAAYAVSGLVLCLTVIGIPFGVQAFKLAGFALWPFGRDVVAGGGPAGLLEVLFNLLWLVLFGWELFLGHLAAGLLLCLTIVGIPFGIQAFKLSVLALWPFGRNIVEADAASLRHVTP